MATAFQQAESRLLRWAVDPVRFVTEVFDFDGTEGKRLSDQQREGLECYRRLITAKLKASRGQSLTEQEARDATRLGLCVHSGHGTGKTAFAAWCLLHFLITRPFCKIPCIAPVGPQLKTNLWPEVHLWLRRSPLLNDMIKWQAEKIFFREAEGKEWFAIPRTVNVKASAEEQAETLAGIHADNMLVVVDESSGVPDPVFRPLEGGLTGPLNMVLQIGNPTQSTGFFHDSFTKHRQDWLVCHWNAEESELVARSHIERMARKYGKDSNAYRIRVLGLPPLASADTLLAWDLIMQAVDRDLIVEADTPIVFGIDVARMGDDKSVILVRQGGRILDIDEREKMKTVDQVEWIMAAIRQWNPAVVAIDVIGYGGGIYDVVERLAPCLVEAVDVSNSADTHEEVYRLRDELWWQLRERFENRTISILNNDTLIGELSAIKYKPRPTDNKIKIESKQEMKDRGLASPNIADALCLSEYAVRFVGPRAHQTDTYRRRQVSAWVG